MKEAKISDPDVQKMLYIAVGIVLENDSGKWEFKNSRVIEVCGFDIKLTAEIVGFPTPEI